MNEPSLRGASSVAVTALITWIISGVIIFVPKSNSYKLLFFIVGVFLIVVLFGFLFLYERNLILVGSVEKTIPNWKATKTERTAGRKEKKLKLKRRKLKSISFKVKSCSPHWRAGVILSKDVDLDEFSFANERNLVFHVGRNLYPNGWAKYPIHSLDRKNIITLYHGQNPSVTSPPRRHVEPTLPEQALENAGDEGIVLTLEVVDPRFHYTISADGFSQSFSGDEYRDISEFLSNVFLAGWGDQNEYEVEFSDIQYETFKRGDKGLWGILVDRIKDRRSKNDR